MSIQPGDIFEHDRGICFCVGVYQKGWGSRMLVPAKVDTVLLLWSRDSEERLFEWDLADLEFQVEQHALASMCHSESLSIARYYQLHCAPPAHNVLVEF